MKIPVYDSTGKPVTPIRIEDDIQHVNGRVWQGKRGYYKGLGVPYHSHYVDVTEPGLGDEYEVAAKTGVFYMPYRVRKKCFIGKTGVFQERFQPQFTDHIGACGVKELSIMENSEEFKRSSVKVLEAVCSDAEHGQYYFLLDYECRRMKYVPWGKPDKLLDLLFYMLMSHWNFVWDKDAISDVSAEGLVSDVADLFVSRELKCKLGTVYAALYSLGRADVRMYHQLLERCGLRHDDEKDYVFNSIGLMKDFGYDVGEMLPYGERWANYGHAVLRYLVQGRNCGHCCYVGLGERVRQEYERTAAMLLGPSSSDPGCRAFNPEDGGLNPPGPTIHPDIRGLVQWQDESL